MRDNRHILFATLSIAMLMNYGGGIETIDKDTENYLYMVPRLTQSVEINSIWNKDPWDDISELYLANYMGDKPEHWPDVSAKVAYDEDAVYVIFNVDDQFVKCVVDEYQGPVFTDSCVEFFFVPGKDISNGYFNLEVNCGGTALFHFQKERGIGRERIPESVFGKIELAASMPRIVEPEITDPVTWSIEYRIPIEILTQYTKVMHPASGVEWKANFYKIGDKTSHPHWLTWSFVNHPTPDFHRPESFGTLIFK